MASLFSLLVSAGVVLAAQFLLGVLLYSVTAWVFSLESIRGSGLRRRWLVSWAEAARALCRAAPYALVLLVGGAALQVWLRSRSGSPAIVWTDPVLFVATGALPCSSAYVMLHAAWREARGKMRAARRQMRLGGQLMFLGAFSLLVLVWVDLLLKPPFRRAVIVESSTAGVILLVAMIGLVCAAFIGVVAALAGKPRPSAYFSFGLYLAGKLGLMTSASIAAASSAF